MIERHLIIFFSTTLKDWRICFVRDRDKYNLILYRSPCRLFLWLLFAVDKTRYHRSSGRPWSSKIRYHVILIRRKEHLLSRRIPKGFFFTIVYWVMCVFHRAISRGVCVRIHSSSSSWVILGKAVALRFAQVFLAPRPGPSLQFDRDLLERNNLISLHFLVLFRLDHPLLILYI